MAQIEPSLTSRPSELGRTISASFSLSDPCMTGHSQVTSSGCQAQQSKRSALRCQGGLGALFALISKAIREVTCSRTSPSVICYSAGGRPILGLRHDSPGSTARPLAGPPIPTRRYYSCGRSIPGRSPHPRRAAGHFPHWWLTVLIQASGSGFRC